MPEDLLVPTSLHALAMLHRWARRYYPLQMVLNQYTFQQLRTMALTAAWEAQRQDDCTLECWSRFTVRLLRRRIREEQPEKLLQSRRCPLRRPDLSQYSESLGSAPEVTSDVLAVLGPHLSTTACGLLRAVYIDQHPIKELARVRNTTESALWMALSRARRKARTVLETLQYV